MASSERLQRRGMPELLETRSGLRSLPAWAISLIFHCTLVVTLGALWTAGPRGTGGARDRPVGVAMVYEAAGGEAYRLTESSGSSSAAASTPATAVVESSLPDSVGDVFSSAEQSLLAGLLPGDSTAAGNAAAAAGGIGLADGGGAIGGSRDAPKTKTTVFGIEGEGSRFVYVFDRSASMNGGGGAPLAAAKRELSASIESLGEAQQFQIIFYNETPLPFGGLTSQGPQILRGVDASKREALRFVRNIVAEGSTQHIDALRMALAMGPDVVFFLTDADLPALSVRQISDLQTRASRSGAAIHTIQFGSGGKSSEGGWIEVLALGTGGQYRYVDISKL